MSCIRQLTLAAVALAIATLAGCATLGSEDSTESERNAAGVPVVPAEAGHVHGMAVNPSDGLLYLGTHGGTLVVDGDAITRVGDSTIDLMGFAVAGADHFYSSGHPGPSDDLPNPVGLIESTDAGETWQTLSLTGESDFHTLGAAGNQVYGFNGQLIGTDDGRNWTPGSAEVAPASLAVDPEDGTRVVATTENGPALSTDSAATFALLDGAPRLLFVAWPTPDKLWGVSPRGDRAPQCRRREDLDRQRGCRSADGVHRWRGRLGRGRDPNTNPDLHRRRHDVRPGRGAHWQRSLTASAGHVGPPETNRHGQRIHRDSHETDSGRLLSRYTPNSGRAPSSSRST